MWQWLKKLFKKGKKMDINNIIYDKDYWMNKHPKVEQTYDGRPLPVVGTNFPIDVRHFAWDNDLIIKKILKANNLIKNSNDDTASAIQKFVVELLTYVGDDIQLKASEYWMYAGETLQLRSGDCEDGAILITSMLLNALPDEHKWRVRVTAGFVQSAPTAPQGGHAYCTYCRCSDNQWVALDWCYYEDSSVPVSKKPLIKNVSFYKDAWFSFNHECAWANTTFEMAGRVKDL
jgi:hypothetical protein